VSLETKRTRRHSRNLVCTFILPPSTFLLRSSIFPFFFSLSFTFSLPYRLFDSLSQSEWHGTVENKWPLMDFLDVRSRADADAAELRCSQECLSPRKYGGTLNYRNRCSSSRLSLYLPLSFFLSFPSFLNVQQITAARPYRCR